MRGRTDARWVITAATVVVIILAVLGILMAGGYDMPRALAARATRYLAINKELLGETAFAGTRIPRRRSLSGRR